MPETLLKHSPRGKVFVVSAPAGTGKTTLVELLVREFPQVLASVSYTTRAPRAGEVPGHSYMFVSVEDFKKRIVQKEFLEYVELYGTFYGTSRRWVEEQVSHGKHVILTIDTQGARLLRGLFDIVTIFVAPPSLEVLQKRLQNRSTESRDVIQKRLEWAEHELAASKEYDYLFINDDLQVAYQVLRSIVIAEVHRQKV